MASNIPPNFIDLFNASTRQNSQVNIIGVVTDALPPTKSKGRDWICTFSIADLTTGQYDDGLKIRFFNALESDLPKIQGTGDVIILRKIKMKEWSGMTIGISSYATSWTLFPASSIPVGTPSKPYIKHTKDPRAPVPSPAEIQYAMLLCNSRDRDSFCLVSKPASFSSNLPSTQMSSSAQEASTFTRREKFSLIKDVQIDRFYDLVGQVVKIFPNNGCVEIYITDYTSNPLLYNYEWGCPGQNEGNGRDGDEFNYAPRNSSNKKWPGPFGRNSLTVTLWPSHSYFAQSNIQEKHFVFLRNVRIKYSKDNKVEGVMYTDKRYPDRIDVSILENHIDDDRVKEVLRRKRDYNERFKSQSEAYVNEVRGLDDKGERQKLSSRAPKNKKKRKLQVEQSAKSKRLEQEKDRLHESNETVAVSVPKSTKSELNKNIHCSHSSIPPRPLSSILSRSAHAVTTPQGTPFTLPFQNIKSRTIVRVIDFFPNDLADFAVRGRRPSEYDVLSENEPSDSEDPQSRGSEGEKIPWEWRFGLVLEDALGSNDEEKATMTAYLADQDAVFLHKLDATDLRRNPQTLALLREKLFILWGDLEERKSQPPLPPNAASGADFASQQPKSRPGGKPFECCLKEYGIRSQRRGKKGQDSNEGGDGDWEENFGWERRWRLWGTTIV